MSVLVLVRHSQASLFADDYDALSPLGETQARLLGEFWARRQTDFDEVYCGPRARQRQTAEIVGSAFTQGGRSWPGPVVLSELDEYDLGGILHTLAPHLARQDRVALFTSGGFIGTSVRLALDTPDPMALEVNWRVRNCSLTEFVFTKDRFTLDSFNALPHLEDPALWTYW